MVLGLGTVTMITVAEVDGGVVEGEVYVGA